MTGLEHSLIGAAPANIFSRHRFNHDPEAHILGGGHSTPACRNSHGRADLGRVGRSRSNIRQFRPGSIEIVPELVEFARVRSKSLQNWRSSSEIVEIARKHSKLDQIAKTAELGPSVASWSTRRMLTGQSPSRSATPRREDAESAPREICHKPPPETSGR